MSIAQEVELTVLGTLQDGGMPHIGCDESACRELINHPDPSKKVVSLGVIDHRNKQNYLFEATPDISSQLSLLKESSPFKEGVMPNSIFLTHAHMGHYTGLFQLGKEALGAQGARVYAMPKMKRFLEQHQPWKLLIDQNNIKVLGLQNETEVILSPQLKLIPLLVPHRDELSETVGYKIIGPNKSALFIPDINKWSLWDRSLIEELKKVDYAFIDATFYDAREVGYRDLSEIPHPFVIESMELLKGLNSTQREKVYFIHLNHTNPLVDPNSKKSLLVKRAGYHIARSGMKFIL